MFLFQMEQVKDVLFGVFAPIYIVPQEDDSVRFFKFKVLTDDLLTGIQISMGISDEDDLPLGGKMEQSRFPFEYLSHFLKKIFRYQLSFSSVRKPFQMAVGCAGEPLQRHL
jgi:hypothetical protein